MITRTPPNIIGNAGEKIALEFLQDQGMVFIEHQYRTRIGEIDLIMRDNEDIVFVEVRFRKGSQYGDPEDSITWHKQKRLIRTAILYHQYHRWTDDYYLRFDVVAISGNQLNYKINWIPNAFTVE